MNYALAQGALFLIATIFNLYIFILLLRLALYITGANFNNPLSQFVSKVTDPLIGPLRFIIPTCQHIDAAVLLLAIAMESLKLLLISLLQLGHLPSIATLLYGTFGFLLNQMLDIFFYAIILRAILGWLLPISRHFLIEILFVLTEPLLRTMRRFIHPISGFDLTPLLALILLKFLALVLAMPLIQAAGHAAFGY